MFSCFRRDRGSSKIYHRVAEHGNILLNGLGLTYVKQLITELHFAIHVGELRPQFSQQILERFIVEYSSQATVCGAVRSPPCHGVAA